MNQRALIAEFVGTFALIFIGAGSIASSFIVGVQSSLVGIALAHGLAIAVMVSATAGISGGHLNPAVTLGLLAVKKINTPTAVQYVIAQCLGAIVAAILLTVCIPPAIVSATQLGTPVLGLDVTPVMGLITEIILTFFLVFVVYGTAVSKQAPKMGGLFIGLTVTMDILVGGPLTGAAMNPARHLGPALISGNLTNLWIYWVGPIIGGVLAATLYQRKLE